MINFKKFERLSKTEYAKSNARLRLSGVVRNLIIEEGLVDNPKIEQIIERITKDRFKLGKSKIEFARTLDENKSEACKVIITFYRYISTWNFTTVPNSVFRMNSLTISNFREPKILSWFATAKLEIWVTISGGQGR